MSVMSVKSVISYPHSTEGISLLLSGSEKACARVYADPESLTSLTSLTFVIAQLPCGCQLVPYRQFVAGIDDLPSFIDTPEPVFRARVSNCHVADGFESVRYLSRILSVAQ